MLQAGQRVTAKIELISDDAALGITDGSIPVPAGTGGTVLGISEDFLKEGTSLKETAEQCYAVAFDNGVNFDVVESELS